MKRRIAVVTGTRAEYGLLKPLCRAIHDDPATELQLIVTGTHLLPAFGMTVEEIENDGLPIAARVSMPQKTDTARDITLATAAVMSGVADILPKLRPDMFVMLGDRYEIFAAATAAFVAQVPIAHIHGGEATEGALDDGFRHAITKLASLHFPVAEEYRRRILQMGEDPRRVHNFGAPVLDTLRDQKFVDRAALSKSLDMELTSPLIAVTFHPVTRSPGESAAQCRAMLEALESIHDAHIVITQPNADAENATVLSELREFAGKHTNRVRLVASLGHARYLSLLKVADAVVGNSSSGLLEAPFLRVPTVNIGDRQKGRIAAASVITCAPEREAITAALTRALDPAFRCGLAVMMPPRGEADFAKRTLDVLKKAGTDAELTPKSFHAWPVLA